MRTAETKKFHHLIDYTNLSKDLPKEDVEGMAKVALDEGFNSICIRPEVAKYCLAECRFSSVIGFPDSKIPFTSYSTKDISTLKDLIGSVPLDEKKRQVDQALRNGASELDPLVDIGNLNLFDVSKQQDLVDELLMYMDKSHKQDREITIKPIFSTELLKNNYLELSVIIFQFAVHKFHNKFPEHKLKFVYKSSSGFIDGANTQPIETSRAVAKLLDWYDMDKLIGLKIAGGIKTKEDVLEVVRVGRKRVTHIGTSARI